MNINLGKILTRIKDTFYFESLKATVVKLKRPLGFMSIVLLLAGCAAFSGRETAGEYVDDAGVTASVKNEIFQDPKLKIFQIHVETFKNQVQLSGFVDSQREAARAGQIARSVKGVQGVNNNLVIRKHGLKHH
jgi:hyperosmotically inducible periplasmic protein